MKRLVTSFLIMSMLATNVFAGVSVSVDELKAPIQTDVINSNGYTLVGIRSLMNILDADVSWNESSRQVIVDCEDTKIVITIGKINAVVNDKEVKMPVLPQIKDGSCYVPLRFVAESLNYKVEWVEDTKLIKIDTGKEGYLLLDTNSEINENTIVLSFEEAKEKAQKKNSSLKTIEESVEYLEETKDNLGINLEILDGYGEVSNNYVEGEEGKLQEYEQIQQAYQQNTEAIISVLRGMKSVNAQQQLSDVNKEMIEDSIDLTLISLITSVKSSSMQIQLLEESIKSSETSVKNLELKNSLGMASDYDLQTAKNSLETNKHNLESLKLSYQNNKEKLNLYLGYKADEDLVIDYVVDFSDFDDIDLESYIIKKKEGDPSIQVLKKNVEIAEFNDRTTYSMLSESKLQIKNELNSANRELSDAQENMEQGIRSAYNNLKTLKENDKNLKLALDKAIRDYNTVVVSYQTGMAIEADVNAAKLGILAAEKAIEDNKISYNTLKFTFERPYMLAGK